MPKIDTDTQNIVKVSSDYGEFKLLDDNRDRSKGHVEKLIQEFEENGNLTIVQPILVNERMEIIDGQHRFLACKERGEPIYYMQREGLTIRDARRMNITHRTWTVEDYAHSYAASGSQHYKKFIELREEYGLTHTITLYSVYGGALLGVSQVFRDGDFEVEDEAAARVRMDKLTEMRDAMGSKPMHHFYVVYLDMLKIPGFDHDRMVRKTKETGEQILRRFGSRHEYARALEEVYNYRMTDNNRLRLY